MQGERIVQAQGVARFDGAGSEARAEGRDDLHGRERDGVYGASPIVAPFLSHAGVMRSITRRQWVGGNSSWPAMFSQLRLIQASG